ncbi:hypothetical protein MPSEU_000522300 [Mayamaea pseudoterrestris]|nr:hypothetical protein MPSEU_000522300 [Mayamaea pseudoterrestris]
MASSIASLAIQSTKRQRLIVAAATVCVIVTPLLCVNKSIERCPEWLQRAATPATHSSTTGSMLANRSHSTDAGVLVDQNEKQYNRRDDAGGDQNDRNQHDDGENDGDDKNQDDGGSNKENQMDDYYKYNGDDDKEDVDDALNAGENAAADDQTQVQEEEEDAADHHDDYFDDKLADDQITDDDNTIAWDDFYAYQDDWRAPDLFPLTTRKLVAYALIIVASTLGASGGIGGGGIVIPVYILVMSLPLKVAVPISAATCLGGGLGSTIVNIFFRRHPLADRPLIDWDLIMVAEPLTLVGTLLGTLFHRVLSEKILVILLVMLLSVTAHTTLSKAMRMYHAEKRYIRHLMAAQAPPPAGTPPGGAEYAAWTGSHSPFHQHSSLNKPDVNNSQQETPLNDINEKQRILILNPDYVTLRSDLAQQDKFTPRTKILALLGMMFVLTFLSINPMGIRCGSLLFYSNYLVMVVYLVACAWAAQTYVVARAEVKELVRLDYVHGDIKWNAKTAVIYPAIFVAAGVFAGTLGIGGGVILVPLLMHFGLHPSVASASSSAMILLTSFSATTSYIIYTVLLIDYAVVGFCLGFCSALVGQGIMRQIRQATSASGRNFERNSYIAFVIGGVVLISALLMTIQYVLLIVQEPDDFQGVCDGISY